MEFKEEEIEKVKIIITELEKFRKKITNIDYIHNKEEFFDIMKKFRRYLVKVDVGRNFEIFYHSKSYKFYKDFFTDINDYYTRSIESMQGLLVMTKGVHNYNSFSELIDKDLIRESFNRKNQELESIDFTNAENFVFAGSGPFPETLLYVYENTNIKNILGLDYNHEAIYMAGEMINGLGLKNINLKHVDAIEFDYKDADIVSIPLFVPNKTKIINQIIETGKKSVQILVRSPKGFLNLVYEELGNDLTPRCTIIERKDIFSDHVNEEIIKLEKYNF